MRKRPLPAVITATEASLILDCSSRTVRRMIANNELPAIRQLPGKAGDWLLYRHDVEAHRHRLQPVAS
jgi:excisionase family DNA binding protein